MSTTRSAAPLLRLKRALLGEPIPTAKAHHERLPLALGLPVFASDALSSAAYATEAIVGILILASATQLGLQLPITVAICVVYVIVVISYQQTVRTHPGGGGAYIVAAENLGEKPCRVAAAALLIDYVLTVAVSVAAGVAAIVSAFPGLHHLLVPLSVGAIAFIAWSNMRGARESGMLFAVPSYCFVATMLVMVVVGVIKTWGVPVPIQDVAADPGVIGSEATYPFMFVLLRAFSAGCVALTGVEAISNGVPAFRPPEAQNAVACLRWLAILMCSMFLGTAYLVRHVEHLTLYSSANPDHRTVVSQIASFVFGPSSPGFYFIQFATAAILILAANTAFADFPRLSSILARDGYLPRPLARLGDRLVFQNGIVLLAVLAVGLVWYFHGELDLLLPLYAVGVFTAFTLSQSGMVSYWRRHKGSGLSKLMVNAFGAVCTGAVAIVILVTKFAEGAWIVLVLMAATVWMLGTIRRGYKDVADQLALAAEGSTTSRQVAILLVPRVHRGIASALEYAVSLHAEVRALHVTLNRETVPALRTEWAALGTEVPLVIVESPFRSLLDPILDYVDTMLEEEPDRLVTVVVAEAVGSRWIHRLLRENVAQQLKRSLGKRRNVVVSNTRYFLK
ncbi:MAG: APC family permease [Nitrospirae bacterium]|nr:APC family permease [Fimbriimonadaceae bacterium]